MEPTHPDRLVENATAPSAGGSPDPDREVRLRMRLPFQTGSSWRLSEKVHGEARSGSGSLSVSVSKGRVMGFGHAEPGTATVLLRC
ncbi:MAG: hypothetical protein ACOX52_17840 [Verrucomicrobiota bacterium]